MGHMLLISNLCSQMRTSALELHHVNFSFWSLLICPLYNEIKTLCLLVGSKTGRHEEQVITYTVTPLGWVRQEQSLPPRFDAGGLLKTVLENNTCK